MPPLGHHEFIAFGIDAHGKMKWVLFGIVGLGGELSAAFDQPDDAFAEIAPDLAVEVVSPGDRAGAVRTKVAQWLRAGTLLVWVIDPRRRSARVYRPDGTARLVSESDMIEGEEVLPGFRVPLARFLDG